ncbi:hypothetical protein GOB57_09075 [Sinorhizobium meliloti]|nr:hypothetical protein [Sinorhizobium meliloti]
MATTEGTFGFVDINPGVPGMAFAAAAKGGVRLGVHGVTPSARGLYLEYFPQDNDELRAGSGDLVLAGLPFSMFARSDSGDPAVAEPISAAAKAGKKASAILFRVPWSRAKRLGTDPEEYRAAVEGHLGAKSWEVTSAVSDDWNDLFVCAVARRKWNGREPLPISFGVGVAPPIISNAREILLARGYPEDFAARYPDADKQAVEVCVDVGNAVLAISGIKASTR